MMIEVKIYDVSTGLQVVNDNQVLGVGKNMNEVEEIVCSWCELNNFDPFDISIGGNYIDYFTRR